MTEDRASYQRSEPEWITDYVGTIYYFNQWQRLDLPELRDCWAPFTGEDVAKLQVGDTVWVDGEPYCAAGKVYGWSRYPVTAIHRADNKTMVECGTTCGREGGGLFKLVDPARANLILAERLLADQWAVVSTVGEVPCEANEILYRATLVKAQAPRGLAARPHATRTGDFTPFDPRRIAAKDVLRAMRAIEHLNMAGHRRPENN